jgi:hypothetical protein
MYTTFARGCFQDLNPWPQSQGNSFTAAPGLPFMRDTINLATKYLIYFKIINRLPHAVIAVSWLLDKAETPSTTAQTSLHLRVPNICSRSNWHHSSIGGSIRCNAGTHRSRRHSVGGNMWCKTNIHRSRRHSDGSMRCNIGIYRSRRLPLCGLCLCIVIVLVA